MEGFLLFKTVCIKTSNKNIADYLLKELEYFEFKEPKESVIYLYQQLSSAITTVTKSMELNQLKTNEVIDKYYKEIRKEKENNGSTSINNSENQVVESQQV